MFPYYSLNYDHIKSWFVFAVSIVLILSSQIKIGWLSDFDIQRGTVSFFIDERWLTLDEQLEEGYPLQSLNVNHFIFVKNIYGYI